MIYSVYLQGVIQKKWCLLCCGILLILLGQLILSLIALPVLDTTLLDFSNAYLSGFVLLLIATIWLPISRLLHTKKELEQTQMDYFKFKRNFKLFNAVLKESVPYDTQLKNTNEITFGNSSKDANTVDILVVTNPLCYYCKDVHHLIESLLERYADNIKVTTVSYTHLTLRTKA